MLGLVGRSDASLDESELLGVSSVVVGWDSSEWLSIGSISVVLSVGLRPTEVVAEVAVVPVGVDTGREGWFCKWLSLAGLNEPLAVGWDLHIVLDLLNADVVVRSRVVSVDRVAGVGVTVGASIGVVAIVGGLSALVVEVGWRSGPVSLSDLSLVPKCAVSLCVVNAIVVEAVVGTVGGVRISVDKNSTIGISLEANEVIVRVVDVDLDVTVGVPVEATSFARLAGVVV